MNGQRSKLNDEIRIIPWWAWMLAGLAFICMQVLFHHVVPRHPDPPPPALRGFLGMLLGAVMGVYFLFLGYVNVDAGRRGMSRALWTVVVMFIPNALGFILYFFLRQPLQAACPQCSAKVESGFNFCPKCNFKLTPTCPACQRTVHTGDVYCPYCSHALSAGGAKAPA